MSVAINVRNIEASSIIGTPLSSENSNTVIGLIKRVYNLLSGFISRITTRIEAVESAVGSLGPGIGSIETAIQNINSNITNLESSIQTTNSNITSNTNRITTVENTVGNIGPRVSSLETAVQNTNSNVTNLESSIQTVNSNVASNANRITIVESAVGNIGPRVSSLETTVQNMNSNVTNLESSIQTINSNVTSNTNRISSLETSKRTFYSFYDVFDKTTLRDFETTIMGKVRLRTYNKASPYNLVNAIYVSTLIKIRSGQYNSIYDYMITSEQANGTMASGSTCYCYKLSFCCSFKNLTATNVVTCIDGIYIGAYNDIKFVSYSQLKPSTNQGTAPFFHLKHMTEGKLFNTKTGVMSTPEDTFDCSIIGFVDDQNVFYYTPQHYGLQVENGDFYTNTSYNNFLNWIV